MTAPVELVRELLYYRDMNMLSGRDWGLITAFLAGGSLALPILAPFAVGSIVAFAVHKLRTARKRSAIAGIQLPATEVAVGATTLIGKARRFNGTVSSLVDDTPVLYEHAVVRDRLGAVLLRRSEGAPFLLEIDDHEPVLVTGVTRVPSPSLLAQRLAVTRGDPHLHRMGVPDDLAITGDLEIARVGEHGPMLAVTGVVEHESIAERAFHRDGGRIPVMRGRVGAPVLIEDRRLVGAMIVR
jgi:hypothetical protein